MVESRASLTQLITLGVAALEPNNARTIALRLLLTLPHRHLKIVRRSYDKETVKANARVCCRFPGCRLLLAGLNKVPALRSPCRRGTFRADLTPSSPPSSHASSILSSHSSRCFSSVFVHVLGEEIIYGRKRLVVKSQIFSCIHITVSSRIPVIHAHPSYIMYSAKRSIANPFKQVPVVQ